MHPWNFDKYLFPRARGARIDGALTSVTVVTALARAVADTEVKRSPHRRSVTERTIVRYLCLFLFTFCFATLAAAQETIFNVPTTDILDKGKVYGELDVSFKPYDSTTVSHFSSFVPRIVAGVGGNVEVGLNVTGNIQPGADSTTLVGAVKWRFYHDEKAGWSLYTGSHLYIPVHNKPYNLGTHTYLAAAKVIGKTRLTAGGWFSSKNVFAANASRGGALFGFEQTVNKKLNINADWYSGKHSAGYFTPGIAFKPSSQVTAYFGYSIGNTAARQGNHFFLFELGYNFN